MNEHPEEPFLKKPRKAYLPILLATITALIIVLFLWFQYLISSPTDDSISVEIITGQSVNEIAKSVRQAGVVRSELLLYAALTYFHDPTNIYAGTYVFTGGEDSFTVADKLANNEIEANLIRITIPEGVRLTQIAAIASSSLPMLDVDEYLANTEGLEGYLFPETYFVPEDFSATDLIDLQRSTFKETILPLREQIVDSGLTEDEVIVLASILEREANDETSMRMVSGILQNRLAIDMPLQTDATIEYALASPLNELPPGQLAIEIKTLESPYNTYKQIGLPPTPIGNPGLQAIEAALKPTPSEYLYYLTDENGDFYYAETLNGHNRNVELYLR